MQSTSHSKQFKLCSIDERKASTMPESDVVEAFCQTNELINGAGDTSAVSLQRNDGESGESSLEIDMKEDQRNASKRSQDSVSDTSTKRGADSDSLGETPTSAKKARSKPKPQLIENMKEHVENNTTEKLTTATLRHWLRERSIHCTTRDKKADLIAKVCKHFSSST